MAASLTKLLTHFPWRQNIYFNGTKPLSCLTLLSPASPNLSSKIESASRPSSSQLSSTSSSPVSPGLLSFKVDAVPSPFPVLTHQRLFSTSNVLLLERFNKKKAVKESERSRDIGTRGELSFTQALELPALELKLTEAVATKEEGLETERVRRTALDWMPRPEDYETVYSNDKKFKELPIIFVVAGKNNTKLSMCDARHNFKAYTTAGLEGFKGAKRGTNIAAQTAAMSFAKKLVRQSKVTHARVVVKGLGPGRLSSLEGFVMGGLNVVSITDDTQVFSLDQGQGPGPRPRRRPHK